MNIVLNFDNKKINLKHLIYLGIKNWFKKRSLDSILHKIYKDDILKFWYYQCNWQIIFFNPAIYFQPFIINRFCHNWIILILIYYFSI